MNRISGSASASPPTYVWGVFLCSIAILLDGLDNQLLGLALPHILADWNLARSDLAPVLAITLVAMSIGTTLAGGLGDRIGRRLALTGSVVVFAVATLGAGFAESVLELGIWRAVAGLGLGGAMPNASALAAELAPDRRRALVVTLVVACVPLGGMLGGFIAAWILADNGWRALFIIAGLISVGTAGMLWIWLPESPSFVPSRRAPPQSDVAPGPGLDQPIPAARSLHRQVASLFAADLRRDTLGLCTAFLASLMSVYLVFGWLPSLLSGLPLAQGTASTGLALFNLGGVIGAITGALWVRRIGSRPVMLLFAGLGLPAALALTAACAARTVSDPLVLSLLFLLGSGVNGTQILLFALSANVYPVAVRATGIGLAVGLGRIGAIASSFIGGWILESGEPAAFFALVAALVMVSGIGASLVRGQIGRSG